MLAGLGFAAAADAAGLHAILGAFIAGLFIREGVLPHTELANVERRVKGVSVGFLAPVFFVTAGFNVSFGVFTEAPLLLASVIVLATVGKVVGTAVFYLPTGYGFREGLAVGAGMNGRGAVEIIVAEIALAAGLIDQTIFSILVFMALFTTATVPILLTAAINHLKARGELVADEREGIVIVGGNPTGLSLARRLGDRHVVVVDSNADHVRAAADAGLTAIKGDGLDETTLEDAGIREAGTLISTTPNGEINLLAAKIAAREFAVPRLMVALPRSSTKAMHALLDEIDAELLYGRPVDVAAWDADIAAGLTDDLDYEVVEPERLLDVDHPEPSTPMSLESLPMVVRTPDGSEPYGQASDWGQGTHIIGIGRTSTAPIVTEDAVNP